MSFSDHDDVTLQSAAEAIYGLLYGMLGKPEYVIYTVGEVHIHLRPYIARVIKRARVPLSCVVVAAILLARFRNRYPQARMKYGSGPRMFLTAFVIATKLYEDETYTNRSWVDIGMIVPLDDLNVCEVELLKYIDYRVVVSADQYTKCLSWFNAVARIERLRRLERPACSPVEISASLEDEAFNPANLEVHAAGGGIHTTEAVSTSNSPMAMSVEYNSPSLARADTNMTDGEYVAAQELPQAAVGMPGERQP